MPAEPELDLDEARGRVRMDVAGAAIVAGVERLGAAWVVGAVTRVVDAWGRLAAEARAHVIAQAADAGQAAAARVAGELRELFATDPAAQRSTPLAMVRSLRREATAVLAAAGIPEVERDAHAARIFPDDVYGIVLESLAELGDDDLGPMLLVWGLGKAQTLRARAARPPSSES
jgi:hypothetical protein